MQTLLHPNYGKIEVGDSMQPRTNLVLFFVVFQSAPVCNASAVLADVYTETDSIDFELGNGLVIMGSNISFTIEKLAPNQCYNATITASNIVGSNTSYTKIS